MTEYLRIKLKHIKRMLEQLEEDSTGIHLLVVEQRAIEEYLTHKENE